MTIIFAGCVVGLHAEAGASVAKAMNKEKTKVFLADGTKLESRTC